MTILIIALIVIALLSIGGWGYSYYGARPVAVADGPVAAGPSPLVHLIGVVGLLCLIAVFVLWFFGGWNFGFHATPP
jgi:hypothetical protein